MTTEDLRGNVKSYSVNMYTEVCISCGIPFAIPVDYKEMLKQKHTSFYCPNGHSQYYSGKTQAELLAEKLKQKENEIAQKITANIQLENQLDKANKKLKNVAAGKCPCCDKTFKVLSKHLANKHPEFKQ
jgi:hypothetical protein